MKHKSIKKYLIDKEFDLEKENFKEYYNELPKKVINKIWDNYIDKSPFDENINKVMISTAFELLFMIGAMLVDDELGPNYYDELGFKSYKTTYGGKNNPYDYSWFEESYDNMDILTYLQKEWIPNNYNEFCDIYDLCEAYPNTLSIEKIENFYTNIFDY